jgi:hypothetical protein
MPGWQQPPCCRPCWPRPPVLAIHVADGLITGLYSVRNPGKLSRLDQETVQHVQRHGEQHPVRAVAEDRPGRLVVVAVTWWPRPTSCGTSLRPVTPVPPATNTRTTITIHSPKLSLAPETRQPQPPVTSA